jgi:hypothetical protein
MYVTTQAGKNKAASGKLRAGGEVGGFREHVECYRPRAFREGERIGA